MAKKNIYLTVKAEIEDIRELAKDVKLFRLRPPEEFSYQPGQFVMVSLWGVGEVPISITSAQGTSTGLELCIRAAGHVTSVVNSLGSGDALWIRGPYGKPFPRNGDTRDLLFVCGGIGVVPIRPLINHILNGTSRKKGTVTILYGSRNPGEVLFAEDIGDWQERGANVIMTVDTCDLNNWKGCIGIVTDHIDQAGVDFKNCTAYLCGPNVMIQATMRELSFRGMPDDRIITTLEAHMKCGVGKCGHCYCGGKLICEDGPVFTYEEIKRYGIQPGIDKLG